MRPTLHWLCFIKVNMRPFRLSEILIKTPNKRYKPGLWNTWHIWSRFLWSVSFDIARLLLKDNVKSKIAATQWNRTIAGVVVPCTYFVDKLALFIHSFIHSFIYSFIRSFSCSFIRLSFWEKRLLSTLLMITSCFQVATRLFLLRQGYVMERLKSSLRKFYGRYGDLIKHYEVSLSQMLHDILGHDHIQWHLQLIRHYTNLRIYYRTGL